MICGRFFRPDVRSRRHQRTCSPQCRRRAKRVRDRKHKQRYRETDLGREQRRRERLEATRYLHFWRKAHAVQSARLDRQAARDYYQHHREAILRKRREHRVRQKGARQARSQ